MNFPLETLAIGTAVCIAFSSLLATPASRHLGALAFTRWRMILAALVLAPIVTLLDAWGGIGGDATLSLILSSLGGIVVGDTALYAAMMRLGPRRTSLLYALSAPCSALLAWLILGEVLSPQKIGGIGLILAGIYLAVLFRSGADDPIEGRFVAGVGFGLLAALGQATGTLLARPALASGLHPIAATSLRVTCAALVLSLLAGLFKGAFRGRVPMTAAILRLTGISALVGMGIGMSLQMMALTSGKVGVVATLSAMTPVAVLPLLWIKTGQRPSLPAWGGAGLAVGGSALMFWPL